MINYGKRSVYGGRRGRNGHSEEDMQYHLSIVDVINKLNTTWKVTTIV